MNGPQAGNTLIVVTYDEYGGQWDHVPPPSDANDVAAHDQFGPGTRVPALLVARSFTHSGVDHTSMDTLSIMRHDRAPMGPRQPRPSRCAGQQPRQRDREGQALTSTVHK
jgi:hypothetical protein